MSTDVIIFHCAPTLAGLKAGSLFSCRYTDGSELVKLIEQQNRLLNRKGVYFALVRMDHGFALIYVYRMNRLKRLLADLETQAFLRQYGYEDFSIEGCLRVLKQRLQQHDFPHEIGVFLEYPLSDIQAFIDNKGANSLAVGCWKVYSNVSEAKRKFASYDKCTRIYCQCYGEGFDITRLTVAG